jgi:hypothetical protein
MYNRARGTDLISPEDLIIACEKMNQMSDRVMLRTFPSGVKVLQLSKLRMLNESSRTLQLRLLLLEDRVALQRLAWTYG